MTFDDKKAYLLRYRDLKHEINSLAQERAEIMALGTKVTQTLSDMPRGSGNSGVPGVVERLAAHDAKMGERMQELLAVKAEIEMCIDTVTDGTLHMILWYKYIRGLTLEQIAAELHYAVRHVKRLHKRAIDVTKCHCMSP